MSENKKITISPIPESMELVAVKTLEKPAESIGNTFADLWYLIFADFLELFPRVTDCKFDAFLPLPMLVCPVIA